MELVEEGPLHVPVAQERLEPGDQGLPRLVIGDRFVRCTYQLVDVGLVDGLDDVDALGEMAVEGTDPDPGLLGDGLHRRTAAALREHLAGGRNQPVGVAPGIGTHTTGGVDVLGPQVIGGNYGGRLLASHTFGASGPSVQVKYLLNGGILRILSGGSFRLVNRIPAKRSKSMPPTSVLEPRQAQVSHLMEGWRS